MGPVIENVGLTHSSSWRSKGCFHPLGPALMRHARRHAEQPLMPFAQDQLIEYDRKTEAGFDRIFYRKALA